ncbi:aminopeptidase N C-terminal domain-containing protein, partial [Salmonella enterica subsp. enterica serovar Virginia]|nr:aminopeptidase N C-terminal domain-containing protein [Salmonella enterica subsp. enterica serovar Virginia]
GDIGKRTLRNACLRFLAFGETELANTLVSKQYRDANNMTDALDYQALQKRFQAMLSMATEPTAVVAGNGAAGEVVSLSAQ